jgi:actin, other eukaryote
MNIKSHYVGSEIHTKEGQLQLRYPISRDQVNWEDVEAIWHHIFYQQLKVEPDEHPQLVTALGRTERDKHPPSSF